MTKTSLLVAAATAMLAAVAVPPAEAHGTLGESYQATAPVPLQKHSSLGGCIVGGDEGVHKHSHPFKVPRAGRLTATVTNYSGDWDIGVWDKASESILVYAANNAAVTSETVAVNLAANQDVDIVACNYFGGPTATASFSFSPSNQPVVSVAGVAVTEGDEGTRAAVFAVTLSELASSTVTVAYATSDVEATAGVDYTARSGTLSFSPGVVTAVVKVPVLGDRAAEGAERVRLVLSAPTAPAAIGVDKALGTIVDDDPGTGRRLTVGDAAVVEGQSSTRPVVFTVSLSKPSTSTVTVAYATTDGTARAGEDYVARSGTLSFAPGVTSLTIKVAVVGDRDLEGDEAFSLVLSGAAGAALADATGTGTIVDDI